MNTQTSSFEATFIETTVQALRQGQTLLYPTDTIWGLGCHAGHAEAIERLFVLKGRPSGKSMIVLIGNDLLEQLIPATCSGAAATARQWLLQPGRPTTVIVPAGLGVVEQLRAQHLIAPTLPATDGSVGLRVPRHAFLQRLLNALGAPLVSTSANFSGRPSPQCYEEIDPALKAQVDVCLPYCAAWDSREAQGSRILQLSPQGQVTTLRP